MTSTFPQASPTVAPAEATAAAGAERIDPLLVHQTKAEIRMLVREIAQICRTDQPLDAFCERFLARVVSALAAVGGAIWLADDDGVLRLRYHVNLGSTRLADDPEAAARHGRLLDKTVADGQPVLVPPESGTPDNGDAGNPTPWLLILGVLQGDEDVRGIVEIFQRAAGGPVTQRGYLRFLSQMCDLANDYLRNRRLRQLKHDRDLRKQTECFVQAIHRSLDVRATAYAIANEGRRLTKADRVSVAVRRGRGYKIAAVSGLDTIDRRAQLVAQMGRLATIVARAREPLWYAPADTPESPQVAEAVEAYVDTAHARRLGVLPLLPPDEDDDDAGRIAPVPVGALIVEQFEVAGDTASLKRSAAIAARSAALALANAAEHNRLPGLLVWKRLATVKEAIGGRALPKTLVALVAAAAAVLSLVFVPAELRIPASGTLQPAVRQHVYAQLDGTVVDVPVAHGDRVSAGTLLAQMRNTDVEVEMTTLQGRKRTTTERMLSVRAALLKHADLPPEERNRLSGELAQLRETADGIDRQLALYRRKQQQLAVRSPRSGQIVTWQVEDALLERPVQKGQRLMTVIDPNAGWLLELDVDESDIRHVLGAASEIGARPAPADHRGRGLPVTFTLHTHPGATFEGRVIDVERTAEPRSAAGAVVRVRVAVDEDRMPELRAGASAAARIHCGNRAIGYVWFRDLIDAILRRFSSG